MMKLKRLLALPLLVLVAVLALAGCGGGSHPLHIVRPPAALTPVACHHVMGGCLPHPEGHQILRPGTALSIAQSQIGPDLSNNDPVYGKTAWSGIAGRSAFAILKVNESTGYIDPTAAPMAADAKRQGLVVGGYDFLHVCLVDPSAEARVFVSAERADGLTGPRTLPGTGDAEWPVNGVSCNGAAWIGQWVATVRALTGRQPMIYSGAWWWCPNVGSWFPFPSEAWVSGYTGSLGSVPRLCGNNHIDLWQYSDSGYNGATNSDMSVWENSHAAFEALAQSTPPDPLAIFPNIGIHSPFGVLHERSLILHYLGARQHPRKYARFLRYVLEPRLRYSAHRIAYLAVHVWGRPGHPNWANNGGPRFQFELKASYGVAIHVG